MANDNTDIPLPADNILNHPISMPPALHEKLNTLDIANKSQVSQMAKTKIEIPGVGLTAVQNDVTQRLLKLPRLTVPQFATQLLREAQLNFQPFLRTAVSGGTAPADDRTTRDSPDARSAALETPEHEALRRLQITSTAGLYQFQRGITLPYMRKSLSLFYEQVTLTKSLITLTAGMAQMLESKLEAIKLNTAAPEVSKVTLGTLVRTKLLPIAAKEAYKHLIAPHIKDIVDPMMQGITRYRAGTRTAKDVAQDARDAAYAAYHRASAGFTNWRRGRRAEQSEMPSDLHPEAYNPNAATPGLAVIHKPAGPINQYGQLGHQTPAPLLLEGPKPATPPPPKAVLLLEGPHPTSRQMSDNRPSSFPVQRYINPPSMGLKPPLITEEAQGNLPTAEPVIHIPFTHPRFPAGAVTEAGKADCLACCDDLVKRLDAIYALLHSHFIKQEKFNASQLNVEEKVESDEEGPRVGSYAAHLRDLAKTRKLGAAQQLIGHPGGIAGLLGTAATHGTTGDGDSWIQRGLDAVFGATVGKVLGKGGSLLKRGAASTGRAGVNAIKSLLGYGSKGLAEATELAESTGGKALKLIPELSEGATAANPALLGIAGKSAAPALEGIAAKAAPKLLSSAVPDLIRDSLAKSLGKKAPILGTIVGGGLAAKDIYQGNYGRAALDATSGLVSNIPVVGTGLSAAIDFSMLVSDLHKALHPAGVATPPPVVNDNLTPMHSGLTGGRRVHPSLHTTPAPTGAVASVVPPVAVNPPTMPTDTGLPPTDSASGIATLMITRARLKAYGFPALSNLNEVAIVATILQLENVYLSNMRATPPGTSVSRTDIQNLITGLGMDAADPMIIQYFKNWFDFRFVPVYRTYLSAIKSAGANPDDTTSLTVAQTTSVIGALTSTVRMVDNLASAYIPTDAGYQNYRNPKTATTANAATPVTSPTPPVVTPESATTPTTSAGPTVVPPVAVTTPPTPPVPATVASVGPKLTPVAPVNDNTPPPAPALPTPILSGITPRGTGSFGQLYPSATGLTTTPPPPSGPLPTGVVGSGECVDLVKQANGLGHTSTWKQGDPVVGNPSLVPGTPIACFDRDGRYGNHTDGRSHAAIYAGPSAKFPGGIRVYDQWEGHPADYRDIGPSGSTAVNNANAFSVIQTTSGAPPRLASVEGSKVTEALPSVTGTPVTAPPQTVAAQQPGFKGGNQIAANAPIPLSTGTVSAAASPPGVVAPQVNAVTAAINAGIMTAGGTSVLPPTPMTAPPPGNDNRIPVGGTPEVRPSPPTVTSPGVRGGQVLPTTPSGVTPSGSSTATVTQNQAYLRQALDAQNITDPKLRAGMAAIAAGESGFKPTAETSYAHTSNDRIRQVFGSRVAGMTDAQLNAMKANPEQFYNQVYGGNFGAKQLGNTSPGDGYLYRGRGQNQLTGRANYAKYGKAIGVDLLANPDLANDPKIAAALNVAYLKDRYKGGGFEALKRANGNYVAGVDEKKDAVYAQYLKSGEFESRPEDATQLAANTPATLPPAGTGVAMPNTVTPAPGSQLALNTHMPTNQFGATDASAGTFSAAPPVVNNTTTAGIPPMMLPSTNTITQGVMPPPVIPGTITTPPPGTRPAGTPPPPTVTPSPGAVNAAATGQNDVIAALGNVTSAIKDMHATLASGKPMDSTNQLLQAHLEKPASVMAPIINPGAAPAATKTANNDLDFSKQMQNAGATTAAA